MTGSSTKLRNFNDSVQYNLSFYNGNVAHFKILWTIKDYVKVKEAVQHPEHVTISHPLIVFPNKFTCIVDLHPNGYGNEPTVQIGRGQLYIVADSKDAVGAWLKYTVSLLSADGSQHHVKTVDRAKMISDVSGYDPIGLPVDLQESFLTNGCLQILLQGVAWLEEPSEEDVVGCKDFLKDCVGQLVTNLYKSEKESDVIISVGDEKFHVLKSILSARSSVFKQMFQKSAENIIVIPNVTPDSFHELIHFMYTDNVTVNIDNMLPEMLQLADKYDLHFLKQICMFKLIENINEDTVVNYLVLGDKTFSKKLKDKCLDYVVGNKRSLSRTETWKSFKSKRCKLVEDVLDRLMDQG